MAAPLMQGGNLLQNGDFEGAASGNWIWSFWDYQNIVKASKDEYDLDQSFFAPAHVPSEPDKAYGQTGVAGKIDGQQDRRFRGGFYQTVSVAAGSRVSFSVWVSGFCQLRTGADCPILLRAGIDPNGGTNWQSGGIQWVDVQRSKFGYVQLTTPEVTVGSSSRVTAFLWGESLYPALYHAAYFDNASLVVTAAPAATPTGAPPTKAPAPPAPAQPASCAQLRWVADVTIPDGAPVAPGAQFVKTWRVKNVGTCAFSGTLNFIGSGNRMNGQSPSPMPTIEAGQEAEVSINLTAPTLPGDYVGTWQPRTTAGVAMENLYLKIKVTGEAPTPTPAASPTPQAPPSSPTPSVGQICVLAFNDRDGDAQHGTDENLLAGVVFALSDASGPRESYTTDGVSEPHCFADLQPGSYMVTIKPPANYSATTPKTSVIALSGGKQEVSFGARRGGVTPTRVSSGSSVGASLGNIGRIVLIVVAILVLIGLGFGGGFLLMSRR